MAAERYFFFDDTSGKGSVMGRVFVDLEEVNYMILSYKVQEGKSVPQEWKYRLKSQTETYSFNTATGKMVFAALRSYHESKLI